MPTFLYARSAVDAVEEQKIRKLAGARHAPADWIQRAKIITLSWAGLHTTAIAAELHCHTKTVREWLHRFNAEGLDGLGDRPIPGRPRRLTEHERGRIIALARSNPPGRAQRTPGGDLHTPDEAGPPQWTLNSLTEAAQAEGIEVHRSQVRRILLAEKVRWRHTRSWAQSTDAQFASKRAAVVELYTHPPPRTTVICADELGPVIPRTFAPASGWSPDGHRIKAPLEYSRGSDKTWVFGGLRIRDGTEVTFCAPSRNSDGWIKLLDQIARANPRGPIRVVTDNLGTHTSGKVRQWLSRHRRIQQVFIPKAACWLNMAEGWWRLLRRAAFAGQSFVDAAEIAYAVQVATAQLNAHAKPWVWGRPAPPTRKLRRKFVYCL